MDRKEILDLIEKYYKEEKTKEKFVPGKDRVYHAGKVYDEKEMKLLVDSCLDFWLTSGRYTKEFERKFSEFLNVGYTTLTNSGSSANLLAVTALTSPELGDRRLKEGDEVITVACSFPTTVNPIIQNRLVPVFIDVDKETLNVDVSKIEDAITEKTKAIVLAHTMGIPFDFEAVIELATEHNLWIIEDSCDALGSTYNGEYVGTIGDIGTFSFYPAHHMTTGEGGALVTRNKKLNKIIRSYRDWGRHCWCDTGCDNTCGKRFGWKLGDLPYGYDHKFIYSNVGYNLKITDMQAAIGVAQLEKLQSFIDARKKNWKKLYLGLKKYEDYFILPKATNKSDPSWFGFHLTLKENCSFSRNSITRFLEDNNVATRLIFTGNIIKQPYFEGLDYRISGDLSNTDYIMDNTFWIGVYPGINDDMIDYILDVFDRFFKEVEY